MTEGEVIKMLDPNVLKIMCCPACKSDLYEKDSKLICSNGQCNEEFSIFKGIPIMLPTQQNIEKTTELSKSKWKQAYREYGREYYSPNNVPQAIQVCRNYILKYMAPSSKLFLEAGCGTARSSLNISLNNGNLTVVCLDYTLDSLLIAKKLFEENNACGFFVCGDLRILPFKEGIFDFIFSDGAIEHFKETQKAASGFYRILRPGGRVLVTVPYISLSTLTHGQLHGNIPNLPLLRPVFEFLHMELLNGTLMKNGYELSFTRDQLKRLFHEFSDVEVGPFFAFQEMSWIGSDLTKNIIRNILKTKLFWYMIYCFGIKPDEEKLRKI